MSAAARLALAVAIVVASLPAAGVDLTGTWDGKWRCTRNDDGVHSRQVDRDVDLQISQTGSHLNATSRFGDHYAGVVVDDAGRPTSHASAAFASCALDGTLSGGDELGVMSIVVNAARGSGRMRGTTHQILNLGIHMTCKWRLRRVDTADPGVAACP